MQSTVSWNTGNMFSRSENMRSLNIEHKEELDVLINNWLQLHSPERIDYLLITKRHPGCVQLRSHLWPRVLEYQIHSMYFFFLNTLIIDFFFIVTGLFNSFFFFFFPLSQAKVESRADFY